MTHAVRHWLGKLWRRARRPGDGETNPPLSKEDWEFQWQVDNWVGLFQKPEIYDKCREYWNTHRHLQDIAAIVPLNDESRILDVGCGISTVLCFLPGRRVGIDPLADRYRAAFRYPAGIELRAAPGEAIPFEAGAFDVVFCSNCIDHTTDPVQTISEIRRVLRPGGWFVLTCEVFARDQGARNEGHPHSLTAAALRRLAAPFECVREWQSPWYGLRGYALGHPPTAQMEHILLLQKPCVSC